MADCNRYRVMPDKALDLSAIRPDATDGLTKKQAVKQTQAYCEELAQWQNKLYAERKQSLLIVLQALDAGGKDGTVHHVINAFNPQGARVVGFKQPTHKELAHDFLWRVHAQTPERGEIVVFNRSHYEDVLVTRVHRLVDKATCKRRYKHIRHFEELLADNHTKIVKLFLHISKDEQLARFAKRLKDPARNWKISDSDYTERRLWDDYIRAFEETLPETSTPSAPWYVIPSDNKWYRNLVVSEILVRTLREMNPEFPPPTVDLDEIRRAYHAAYGETQPNE